MSWNDAWKKLIDWVLFVELEHALTLKMTGSSRTEVLGLLNGNITTTKFTTALYLLGFGLILVWVLT